LIYFKHKFTHYRKENGQWVYYFQEVIMDKHKRTLIKTLTWRLIALLVTVIVFYIYSRDAKGSLTVGLAANIIKMAIYYVHERVWNRIRFGRVKEPEYQI